jgi:hypothetical protein
MTVRCDVGYKEMLYVLGALRLIQEYPTRAPTFKAMLRTELMKKYPLTGYIMCEELKFGANPKYLGLYAGNIGHANNYGSMSLESLYQAEILDKLGSPGATIYSETLTYAYSWSEAPNLKQGNVHVTLNKDWAKKGGATPEAMALSVSNTIIKLFKQQESIKKVPKNVKQWVDLLREMEDKRKRKATYDYGYRKGWRLRA